jgi:4-hydroxyphenylacetate 3-monooxygenase
MLLSGSDKLARMRDGRAVYIGKERVDDVTQHPAFRGGAETIAALYDLKADRAQRELFSFDEDGESYSLYWLRCRTRDDLAGRMRCCKAIADATFGLIGRSPDHVAGIVTGLAMNPAVLDSVRASTGATLLSYYEFARRNDIYLSYAVTPPSGLRSAQLFPGQQRDDPSLKVTGDYDGGLIISGMKMLATGAVFADEVWVGNLAPLDDKRNAESITCAVPLNAPGLSLWARQPYALHAANATDYPLSYRFDETDSVLVCENVKVPWERIFLHDNGAMSRAIYLQTPANCYANHQSNVRFWAKMGLIVGLASRACIANGVDKIPAVRETLGRLAALEATIAGLVHGQLDAFEQWPDGYATPNRRIMYATLNWCQEHHTEIVDILRSLMGGVPLQMPASSNLTEDAGLASLFERWWGTASLGAMDRMRLYKLGWDLTGSEFAGRHALYEKFYAGNSTLVRNSCDREAPWDQFHEVVDRALGLAEDSKALAAE